MLKRAGDVVGEEQQQSAKKHKPAAPTPTAAADAPDSPAETASPERLFYLADAWEPRVEEEARLRGFVLPDKKDIRCFDDFLKFLRDSEQEEFKGLEFVTLEGGVVFKEMPGEPHGDTEGSVQVQVHNYLQPWWWFNDAYGTAKTNTTFTWRHHNTGAAARRDPDVVARSGGRVRLCVEIAATETAQHAIDKCNDYYLHDQHGQTGPHVCVVINLVLRNSRAAGPVERIQGWVVRRGVATNANVPDAEYDGGWRDQALDVPSNLLNCGRRWNLSISLKAIWKVLRQDGLTV